jgi:hypothetical protein
MLTGSKVQIGSHTSYILETPNEKRVYENRKIDYGNEVPFTNSIDKINFIAFEMVTMTVEEFIILLSDTTFSLKINDINVFTYEIRFLHHFNPIYKVNNNFICKIPDFLNVQLYGLLLPSNSTISCHLSNTIGKVHLSMEKCWTTKRKEYEMCLHEHKQFFQKIDTLKYHIAQNDLKVDFGLCFNNNDVKGYFIECNIDNIVNIELRIHGGQRFDYSNTMISHHCTKISNTLLYFPFNSNMLYTDNTVESFHGSINNNRVNTISCIITFAQFESKINIHSLGLHMHKYKNKIITDEITNSTSISYGLKPISHLPIPIPFKPIPFKVSDMMHIGFTS